MIEGNQYIETLKAYFNFLVTEFGFTISEEKIRGNAFYDLQYKDKVRVVSVSYENIEDYLQVIIFMLQNGRLPDYDDKTKTLHLNKLNATVISKADKSEINLNNEYFAKFNAKDELERKLLKSAKELRLCLKHFNEL
jgi:hypothetical protein